MPYQQRTELPKAVQENLPQSAQDLYREAFNSAWEQYSAPDKHRRRISSPSREETAHREAWSAVKGAYENQNGKWVPKV